MCQKWPLIGQIDDWFNKLGQQLCIAGGASDQMEIAWLNEARDDTKDYIDLQDSGVERFRRLDTKLSYALQTLVTNSEGAKLLQGEIQTLTREANKIGTMLTGRQIAHLIARHFRTNTWVTGTNMVKELFGLTYPGDKKMPIFRETWHRLIQMCPNLDTMTLQTLLENHLMKSPALTSDMAHYNRLDPSNPEKSLLYLHQCMDRYIEREHLMTNQRAQEQTIHQLMKACSGNNATPAKTERGEQGKKGNRKGKGKGKGI